MGKTALLIVDVQCALVEKHPCNESTVICNIKDLIKSARDEGIEVIYVRHDGGAGDELEENTNGWKIYSDIAPNPNEKVIDKKFNSAFKETGLHEYLSSKDVETVVLVGMQTEYCVDATCKSAFDLGYSIIIPCGCTATFDNDYFSGGILSEYYEKEIWNVRYARVIPVAEVIASIISF